jgi:glycerophosphoryl diester phosphodiesterase
MKLFKSRKGLLAIMLGMLIGLGLVIAPSAEATAPPSKCVLVHRGLGPENSIYALNKAVRKGACGFETDVRFTRDHVGILNHDPKLNRTTTGRGYVADRRWSYVSQLHVRKNSWGRASNAKVATYQRALVLCRDSRAQVCMFEAKRGVSPDDVRSMAQDAISIMGAKLYKVILETDTYRDTRILNEFPQVSVGFVGFSHWPDPTTVKASGADGIIVTRKVMSYARVASASRAGLWVTPYTIETSRQFRHVRRMGAHGAMTDSSRLLR